MKLFGNSKNAARTNGRRNDRISGWKIALIVILAILAAAVLTVLYFLKIYAEPPAPVVPDPPEVIVPSVDDPLDPGPSGDVSSERKYKEGYYNILLAGTDNDGLRTDTIMVARLDTTAHTVSLMSIPRDTRIETEKGYAKINSVYGMNKCGEAGMEALVKEVEVLLGFRLSGYALVDLRAFTELVDLVGGLYFDVPQDMFYEDPTQHLYIDLKKGYQFMDGNKAMQLVRFRDYAAADIQRTRVQQKFMVALARNCFTLSNLGKIGGYCEIFAKNVTTNFTAKNLIYLAQELINCNFESMRTYTLTGEPERIDGVEYWVLDTDYLQDVIEADFNPFVEE